jgi:putative transposase
MEKGLFKNRYRIKSARMQGYDYSQNGYYFITICTYKKIHYFGNIINKKMILSEIGEIVHDCWLNISNHFQFVILDDFIIMPNHVHGIIQICKHNKNQIVETQHLASPETEQISTHNAINKTQNIASLRGREHDEWKPNKFGPQSQNLASIIRGFKIGVTKYANDNNIDFQWQPRFHDRIIRDESALYGIREYIRNNPEKWHHDRNNKENIWI